MISRHLHSNLDVASLNQCQFEKKNYEAYVNHILSESFGKTQNCASAALSIVC